MRLEHALMAAAQEVPPFGPSPSAHDGARAPDRRAFLAEPIARRGDLAARHLLDRDARRPASHVSPGERQLAASLGVDPAAFTWAELTRLKILREREED